MGRSIALGKTLVWSLLLATSIAHAETYVVRVGDTLSSIAQEKLNHKVYGKTGSLQKLISLNPGIENIDRIYPGAEVELGGAVASSDSSPAEEPKATREPSATQDQTGPPEPTVTPSPEPVREVASQPAETPPSIEHGYLSLLPAFSFTGIDSVDKGTGSRGIFLSKLNPGMNFRWGQVWSEDWESYFQFNYARVSLDDAGAHNIQGESQNVSGFGVTAARKISSKWKLLGSLGSQQEIFIRALSPTTLRADSVAIPRAGLGAQYEIYSSDTFQLNAGAMFFTLFGRTTEAYTIQTGTGYRGSLGLTESISEKVRLEGEAFFDRYYQNTSIDTRSTAGTGFSLGIRLDLPGKTK